MKTSRHQKAVNLISSWKQFLLSLLATSFSIALTFGTAAIINHVSKQKDKREIVMMVMYDMYNSLQSVQKADSTILNAMQIQLQMAKDTSQYESLKLKMLKLMPQVEYTETTEHIFSSSIETINTVGNVLFTEDVAEFYRYRKMYKTEVCDAFINETQTERPINTHHGYLRMNYLIYGITSASYLSRMQYLFAQCKQMMKVTDKEIDSYRQKRQQLEATMTDSIVDIDQALFELMQLQREIDAAM